MAKDSERNPLREYMERAHAAEAENRLLRHLLWLRHGHKGSRGLYGDDGEMQCNICLIDFKRATAEDINARFLWLGRQAMAAGEPTDAGSIPVDEQRLHALEYTAQALQSDLNKVIAVLRVHVGNPTIGLILQGEEPLGEPQ